ncbi:interstitial collagenase-like [Lytechinus variegatus]|uniref:interstitial collagenase-like n=1 Tax=Lytechinus variegatus TaxID=7654 RepID=UPI001BB254EC|nr:interstitial collagenase-like [Lytechinus variegatus]
MNSGSMKMEGLFFNCIRHCVNSGIHTSVLPIIVVISLLVCKIESASISEQAVKHYLEEFGYLTSTSIETATSEVKFTNALHKFQKFSGLPDTGEEDTVTMTKILEPRCGNSDIDDQDMTSSMGRIRRKRFVIIRPWAKNDLTYKISIYTTKLPAGIVNSEVARAFKLWSDVALLTFTQIYSGDADIDISFHTGSHNDDRPFDGPGRVLGHAFPPSVTTSRPDLIGHIHLDEEENWTANSRSGKNLWLTVAHEIGHAIGLGHSQVLSALMYPWYRTFDQDFTLDQDDIRGIQFLYGARPGTELVSPTNSPQGPNNPNIPDLCSLYTDTITFTARGNMYAFKDGFYWMLEKGQLVPGFPKLISGHWPGLQSNLSASLSMKNPRVWGADVGKTYFFKTISGSVAVWKYSAENTLEPGYPKAFENVFSDFGSSRPIISVQGVAEISGNGETIFIMDNQIYLYGWEKVFRGPYTITDIFPNLYGKVASVIQGADNYLYFFMENGLYYQVSPWTFNLSTYFPRLVVQDWFSCNE